MHPQSDEAAFGRGTLVEYQIGIAEYETGAVTEYSPTWRLVRCTLPTSSGLLLH